MPTNGQAQIWTRIVTLVASALATVAFAGGGLLLDSALDRLKALEGIQRGLEVNIARSNNHVEEHEKQSEYWIGRIESNSERLGELATNAAARPDPFTGTEGRQLERRIDQLERGLDQIEHLREQMKEIEQQMDEDRRYYRQSVVPLIEQSNLLQMQRIKDTN